MEEFIIETYNENQDSSQMVLASTGQRFANLLLDYVFFLVFSFIVGIVMGAIGLDQVIDELNDLVVGIILALLYYVPQEGFMGKTIAKRITRTRVVNKDGTPITLVKAFVRTVCRFIPFEIFSFLGGKGCPVGWHDSIPRTRVISIKKVYKDHINTDRI